MKSQSPTPRKSPIELKKYELLDELNGLAKTHPNAREYSKKIIFFSCGLLAIGLSAYLYVQNYLPLPDIRTVYRRQSEFMTINPKLLSDISNLDEVLKQYKNLCKNCSNDINNKYVIAWDALSSSPFLNIDKNKNITGLLPNDITLEESFLLEKSFDKFEKFIHDNSNYIVNALFVFAMHPLNPNIPTFIIHVHPANSGKCNNITTEIMIHIASKCKDHGFNIVGFSSDGDNCMSKFHKKNIELFECTLFDIFENYLYFSDVLHILKRGRYHFVKQLHKRNSLIIDQLRILLNLPSEIFSNASYTKMHESLAVRMFSFEKILILYKNSYFNETIYFLPFVLLNEAISNRIIDLNDRVFILNIIRAFCKHLSKNSKIRLSQKYLIKPNLITDILSTVYSFNYVLTEMKGYIDLNRCSTSPLEHNFGIARMSCRNNNRIERLLLQFSRIDVRRLKKIEIYNRTMNHRVTNHGSIINIDKDIIDLETIYKNTNRIIKNFFSLEQNYVTTVELFKLFEKLENKLVPQSRFFCKSSDIFVNPSTVSKIQTRLENDLGKRCRWSSQEEELLIKLNKDIGGNCTQISKYFEERTPKSIFIKSKQLYKKKIITKKPFLH